MYRTIVSITAAFIFLFTFPSYAKTFHWSSRGDILTMDPHAQNEGLTNNVSEQIYEPLVQWSKEFKLESCLAVSWSNPKPTVWQFKLRPNVKFHDGTPFNADDVVFSIQRVLSPTSNFKSNTTGIIGATKVDNLTVDINLSAPNPVLLQQLTDVRMMGKAWSIKNKAERPQDYNNKEETFAARNANGTGPYILKSREPDVKTVLMFNPNWWGKREGDVNEVIYLPIKADATRVAALLSGEVDFVLDPPPQDVARLKTTSGIKVTDGNEYRTIFLGFDQYRDELLYSNVKGKNPFKDKRVRQAVYHTIDAEALKSRIMRGLSQPAGVIVAPQVHGWNKALDTRLPHNTAKAKKLLAEAGYPSGFEVTLDCPNNRYINDEQICQAVVAMLAQIGIQAKLNAMPRASYFPKIQKYDTSFYMLGWGVSTFDTLYALDALAHSVTQGSGSFNLGRYSNPKLDQLIDAMRVETDLAKRDKIIEEALKLHSEEVAHVPLHHQVIPWAMKSTITIPHRADNRVTLRWLQWN
ncbi:MAG: ABC transporter substrate-binding protein [Pseudomonadota bacterium]